MPSSVTGAARDRLLTDRSLAGALGQDGPEPAGLDGPSKGVGHHDLACYWGQPWASCRQVNGAAAVKRPHYLCRGGAWGAPAWQSVL